MKINLSDVAVPDDIIQQEKLLNEGLTLITDMEIAEKTVVSLRYIMKNSEGEEIENTIGGAPVQYVHGAAKILPQLEVLLKGMKAGDKKSVTVELPDIFHFDIEIDEIRMATAEEIEARIPIVRNDCSPGCCC